VNNINSVADILGKMGMNCMKKMRPQVVFESIN